MLSFEWTLIATLLTIGIVAGLTSARDAIIEELGDTAQAAGAIDQSYTLPAFILVGPATKTVIINGVPVVVKDPGKPAVVIFHTNDSVYLDDPMIFTTCARTAVPAGQPPFNTVK